MDDGLSIGVDNGEMPGDNTEDSPWEFGASSEYPALKVDFGRDGAPTVAEFGDQSRSVVLNISDILPLRAKERATITIRGAGFSAIPSRKYRHFSWS